MSLENAAFTFFKTQCQESYKRNNITSDKDRREEAIRIANEIKSVIGKTENDLIEFQNALDRKDIIQC